ncbi:MAG: alpha/beta hydrolase [Alphaproteobacteria bacterium]|nr:alpha/beta hydrolase [Alphaproteobacteria bacterium]
MAAADASTGSVRSGDVGIFYRRFGTPGRTPLLIVHGLSYFSYDWIGVASALATGREIVAIDMRGFGQSDWSSSRDYKLETLSSDAMNVLDALGWRQAVLIGHSFGGRVALATAGWKPERAAAVALLDFAPDIAAAGRRATAERIGRQPDLFATLDAALAYHGEDDTPAARARYEAFLKAVPGGFQLRRDLHFRDNFRKALDSGQSAPVPAYLWPMLSELKVPALVVRGSHSDMLDAPTLEKARACNPRVTGIELESGHDLAGDNPDGLVRVLRSFLDANRL